MRTAPDQITLGELLRDRAFALYLAGQTASGAGSALSAVALVFAVLSVSRSAGSVGLVLLATRVPGIVLTLAGGVIADRWSRQRIAVCTDAARTVLQAVTGVLLISGHATVLVLAALQLLAGGAGAIFNPAAGALVVGVAPRGQLRRASAVLGTTTAIAQTAGLALSGLIVALAGPGTSFLIDGATYAVSSATLALIASPPVSPSARHSMLSDLRAGWAMVRRRGWLVTCAAHETIVNVLVLSPFFVLGPLVAQRQFGGAPAWSAIALGYVLGSLAAAQITYHWSPRRPVRAALVTTAALAPLLALLGLRSPLWLIVPAAGLAGAQTTIYNTLLTSALQANLPGAVLGRATAIAGLGSTVLTPVGMGLAGAVAGILGTSAVLIGAAGLGLAATTICASLPSVRVTLSLDRDPATR